MKQKLKSDIAKNSEFCKLHLCNWQKPVILQSIFIIFTGIFESLEVKTMQTLKTIVADKYFWLGIIIGFACGVLHHYYAL